MQNPDKRCRACGAPMARKKGESFAYFKARQFCDRSCYAAFYNAKPIWESFSERTMRAESGCIEWLGYRDPKGYGRFSTRSGEVVAHRVAYAMHFGSIPEGMHVLHRCDNRSCCNPQHLFLGTNDDNMADMKAKGRAARQFGKDNPNYRHGRNCREIEAHRNAS